MKTNQEKYAHYKKNSRGEEVNGWDAITLDVQGPEKIRMRYLNNKGLTGKKATTVSSDQLYLYPKDRAEKSTKEQKKSKK